MGKGHRKRWPQSSSLLSEVSDVLVQAVFDGSLAVAKTSVLDEHANDSTVGLFGVLTRSILVESLNVLSTRSGARTRTGHVAVSRRISTGF